MPLSAARRSHNGPSINRPIGKRGGYDEGAMSLPSLAFTIVEVELAAQSRRNTPQGLAPSGGPPQANGGVSVRGGRVGAGGHRPPAGPDPSSWKG